jgi:hypothetical protein
MDERGILERLIAIIIQPLVHFGEFARRLEN